MRRRSFLVAPIAGILAWFGFKETEASPEVKFHDETPQGIDVKPLPVFVDPRVLEIQYQDGETSLFNCDEITIDVQLLTAMAPVKRIVIRDAEEHEKWCIRRPGERIVRPSIPRLWDDDIGWIDCEEAGRFGLIPLNVWDADGNIIRRRITRFNVDTGEVVSMYHVMDQPLIYKDRTYERQETFPAPLTWRTEKNADFRYWSEGLWDKMKPNQGNFLHETKTEFEWRSKEAVAILREEGIITV